MVGRFQEVHDLDTNRLRYPREDQQIDCLIGTVGRMKVGLTLTKGTVVILMEPLYSYSDTMQAFARIHRLGQKKVTYAYVIEATRDNADGTKAEVEEEVKLVRSVRKFFSAQSWAPKTDRPGGSAKTALDLEEGDDDIGGIAV